MSPSPPPILPAAEGLLLACQALAHVPGLPPPLAQHLRERTLDLVLGLTHGTDALEARALACEDAVRLCGTVLGLTRPVREALNAAQVLKDQLTAAREGPHRVLSPPPTLEPGWRSQRGDRSATPGGRERSAA